MSNSVPDRSELVHRIAVELDKPSIYMGGPTSASKRKAEAVVQIVEAAYSPAADEERQP